jgi:energy-coupling factor transporter ATP-binding protein EcfA2
MENDPGLRSSIISSHPRENNEYDFPKNIFAAVCGKTGSGKTTYVLNLLLNSIDENGNITKLSPLAPDEIYICCPLSNQELYSKFIESNKKYSFICSEITMYPDIQSMPLPSELGKKNKRKVVIFDDVITEKNQTPIMKWFTTGRHVNGDMFYLTQKFSFLPPIIKDNLNTVISFDTMNSSLWHLWHRYVEDIEPEWPVFKSWWNNKNIINGKRVPKCIFTHDNSLRDGIIKIK